MTAPRKAKAKGTRRRRAEERPIPVVTSTVTPPERNPDAPHMVGYARVSMSDQSNQRQIDELVSFGVDVRDIYTDTASGRNMKRPGWEACCREMLEGDLLVVHSVDRIGRDLVEIVQTVRDLEKKGVNLKVLSMDIDTRTPNGRLMLGLLATMAQWERELILERTMHGLERAKARGKVGGVSARHGHQAILDAAERFGVNQAGRNLSPPMSASGFKKALERAREWQHKQKVSPNADPT